ncbi:MAG: hypothetical protein RIR79_2127 [Pseudomonadota bacterium]|jgi:CRISPR-associated protein Cmr5
MQTLQQLRAKHALSAIQKLAKEYEKDSEKLKKLKARASELPFMIHANGLGQALAFFKSKEGKEDKKDKDGYGKLFEILQNWLTEKGRPFAEQKDKDLMAAVIETDFQTYRIAQAEAIQYMDWVKKFASAYL